MAKGKPFVELSIEQQALTVMARALRSEADGKKLRRELTANLRKAAQPAVLAAKSSARSIPSSSRGTRPGGGSLRAAIARLIRAQARTSGAAVGVRIRVGTKGMPREFKWAARRTNRKKGWRHPLFGDTDKWVQQYGKVGWFEDPMKAGKSEYQKAVLGAMAEMAARISRKA